MEQEIVLSLFTMIASSQSAGVVKAITTYGIYVLAGIALVLFIYQKKSLRMALGVFLAVLVSKGIGLVFYRPRPFVILGIQPLVSHISDSSFPSDHATVAFACAALFWPSHKVIAITIGIGAIMISITRIMAGLHYISDILGGVVIGIGSVLFMRIFVQKTVGKYDETKD